MIKSHPISREQLVCQEEGNFVSDMNGEKVMLSIHNGKYYNLGEVGGEIWEQMKEPIIVHELISSLIDQYDVEKEKCTEQVMTFLNLLHEEGLMQLK